MKKRINIPVILLIFIALLSGCTGNTSGSGPSSSTSSAGTLREVTGSETTSSDPSKNKASIKNDKETSADLKKNTGTGNNGNKKTAAAVTTANRTREEIKNTKKDKNPEISVTENGKYTSKEEVAAYLIKYKKLPSNYITKNKAMAKGWNASEGNLWEVTDRMSIGGDVFGNFEKKLPVIKGIKYYECDIDYKGGRRNAKRIIYSDKGDIYYTEDHYNTFEKLK